MSKEKNTNWFGKLLSSNSAVSSKRVVSVFTLLNLITFCYIATFTDYELPEFMFDGLALISGGGLGLTVVESIFKKPSKEEKINEQPPVE
jgi:hypothetical protein